MSVLDQFSSNMPFNSQQPSGPVDCSVLIAACASVSGSVAYCVTVKQEVQSWNVFRSHNDFLDLSRSLSSILPELPLCPNLRDVGNDVDGMFQARGDMQRWLSAVLTYPGACESHDLRRFLTMGVNAMPPQWDHLAWVTVKSTLPTHSIVSPSSSVPTGEPGNLGDMDMSDMFQAEDDGSLYDNDNEFDEDEEQIPSASERYRQTNEQCTYEDYNEMIGDVEMVDESYIGSLAQSLGASHLGRSLQLQKEMEVRGQHNGLVAPTQGLNLKSSSHQSTSSSGGLGSAMANASGTSTNCFHQTVPISPPRLDSFLMIRVIGKGSFGMYQPG